MTSKIDTRRLEQRAALLGLIAVAAVSASWQSARAQFPWQQQSSNQKKPDATKKRPKGKPAPTLKPNYLEQPIALPDLPSFTGQQDFMSGISYPDAPNGPGYVLTYNVENTQQQVLDWWKNALRIQGWNITMASDSSVHAKNKDGHTVTVSTNMPHDKKIKGKKNVKVARASYSLFFHVHQPQK